MAREPVRLVPRPVFLLSSIRSGSTLLRCLLNSHSAIHAPHELHLRYLTVETDSEFTTLAMSVLGYSADHLKFMLWDRLLHDQLARSGKALIVDKSPSNAWIHDELLSCWPEARLIILRRHPADIVRSIVAAADGREESEAVELVLRFGSALDHALAAAPTSAVVRYEDLTEDPGKVCRRLCDFLDLPFEEGMLDYGAHHHGPFVYGIGDWSERIRSGQVQRRNHTVEPRSVADALRDLCVRWGYR